MPYYEDIVHLCDIPRYHAKHNPDEIAFIYEDKQTTYKDFDLKTEKVANGLVALGVKDQDRVAFMDKNSDIFYEVVLGCSKANAVVVGINWRLAPPEVAYILNDSGAKVLFVGEEFFDLAEKILELSGVGFRASLKGKVLNLQLGFSHDINFEIPDTVKITVEKQTIIKITGSDKQEVGMIASKIKSFKPPEPYKGKGIKEQGQYILRKEGKKK